MLEQVEYKIKIRQWLTNPEYNSNPVPARVLFGAIEKETDKAYFVNVKLKPHPTKICMKCGRKLTHPVSLLWGLGPECSKMFYEHPFTEEYVQNNFDELQEKLEKITFYGWIPKSGVQELEETGEKIEVKTTPQLEKTNKKFKTESVKQSFSTKFLDDLTEQLLKVL